METPNNFEDKIEQISDDGVNIESAQDLITEMNNKIEAGEALSEEDTARIKEKLSNLREAQMEVDDPEIRNAIARMVEMITATE